MFTLLLASAAALTGVVSAQNSTTGSSSDNIGSYSTSGPLYIDPNAVDLSLRQSWCTGQKNNCPFICAGPDANQGDAFPNTCDEQALTYDCTCRNGNQPNISAYQDTLPFYICQQWIIDCTADHPNDAAGQFGCQSVTCGTRNATTQANSAGGSSASASGSPSSSATPSSSSGGSGGSSSGGSPSSSSDAAQASSTDNAAMALGPQYGMPILVGGMLALFGLAL